MSQPTREEEEFDLAVSDSEALQRMAVALERIADALDKKRPVGELEKR